MPGRAAAAPGSATPELDSTHMKFDKKRSVVPRVQSMYVCAYVCMSTAEFAANDRASYGDVC